MVKVSFNGNKNEFILINSTNADRIKNQISLLTGLCTSEFYIESNGKSLSENSNIDLNSNVHCILRIPGGKGGFGSMLRAIGAQIEKTTNREACRDLSGRRLRDINEEKRLRAWLEKQGEREREVEERKKRKIEKLLAVPKHEFKDKAYEEARLELPEKVNDAIEEGFKKELVAKQQLANAETQKTNSGATKRKSDTNNTSSDTKKMKGALWIDDGISDTDGSSSDDSDDSDVTNDKKTEIKK